MVATGFTTVSIYYLIAVFGREICNMNNRNHRGQTLLMIAARAGQRRWVRWLLTNDSIVRNINVTDKDGNTALLHAAIGRHERIVLELVTVPGIDIGVTNSKG